MTTRLGYFAFAAITFACGGRAAADVTLPAIFSDHMVLQGGMRAPVWGSAEPGEQVTVHAAGQEKSTTADAAGKWRVELDPLASDEPIQLVVRGNNTVTFQDVLVGETWLCSGQSNMGFALVRAKGGAAAIKAANRPRMRLFTVGRKYPAEPQSEMTGRWELCTPESAREFSAVAYLFGVELQQALDRPIGLIDASWGGTRAEAWLPRAAFDALKLPYEPQWTEHWLRPEPAPNGSPAERPRPYQAPAVLYNGMIAPMAGYAIRGAVWYQGETNTAYGEQYGDVLGALITGWRGAWGQGDFPFLVVQLPNFRSTRFWPNLRAGQAKVAREVPNVGLAVTIDVGNPRDIHPTDKLPVAQRLALIARKTAYDENLPYTGPTFQSMRVIGPRAAITFDHAYGRLQEKGDRVEGFEIAGADGRFVPAEAKIRGERIIVSAPGVTAPTAVRYGWANDPRCTLYNSAGLPAAPFEAVK